MLMIIGDPGWAEIDNRRAYDIPYSKNIDVRSSFDPFDYYNWHLYENLFGGYTEYIDKNNCGLCTYSRLS